MNDRIWPSNGSPLWEKDFLFGVATAAYQIEGAGKEDGRLPCIWDTFCDKPNKVIRNENGEVACDHYHRWEEDVEHIKSLGVDAYRLSIAWPRVMHMDGSPNQAGLTFYRNLLNKLKAEGIKAFVTLYHWDLPQWLEERGGWVNRETAYRFKEYTRLVVSEFDELVESWATFNEPWCSAYLGYANGHHAPGLTDIRYATQAAHHMMLAHGLAVEEIRTISSSAKVGIVLNLLPSYAATSDPEDIRAARLSEIAQNDWFLEPLLSGEYAPELFRAFRGAEPVILPGDMTQICQPMDFLGVNYYFRALVMADGITGYQEAPLPEGQEYTAMDWEVYPDGLKDTLVGLKRQYKNLPPIYITENGLASYDVVENEQVNDVQRIRFIQSHLESLSTAMKEGVDVRGYFAWSLMDNFEWAFGYEKRFGLFHVDYETQVRTPKASALSLRAFLEAKNAKV